MRPSHYTVADLLRVMQRLRDPHSGCPWDLRQDFRSIVPSTLEECYELAHAIEQEDYAHVAEELGDVLFQVIFYAQLGNEQHLFSFDTIVTTLVEKLIRRHPHVFAGGEIEGVAHFRTSVEEVGQTWEAIKQAERNSKDRRGLLADVPLALPALPRAQKVQKRAAQVNFDWAGIPAVLDKLQEELDEMRQAVAAENADAVHDELGDVLFTTVNLARHLDLDAEESLRRATAKFEARFGLMEKAVAASGGALSELSEAQLDQLWRRAKDELGANQRDL
jgi:nucleoside triphosphate diphosphatase